MDSAVARRVAAETPFVHETLFVQGALAQAPAPSEDPTFYPVEQKMGEHSLQRLIVELLRPLVERWLRAQGKATFVGADQFIYWEQAQPTRSVAPDVYVLPGVPPGEDVQSWKVWETGIVPSFALEVVSSKDWEKDYVEAPQRYKELGVAELIIFDPHPGRNVHRVRWQRHRKLPRRGFVLIEASNADRISSHVLGCFLRAVGKGTDLRIRLATGRSGVDLFPTEEEAERAAKEEERAAKEAALAAKEEERAAKETALARVAALEALLAAQTPPPKP